MTEKEYQKIIPGDVIFNMKDKDATIVKTIEDGFITWEGGGSTPKSHLLGWEYVSLMRDRENTNYFEQCGYNGYHKTYIGTIEPRYNDSGVFLDDTKSICDDALAFIYGAIKKYGNDKNALTDLKGYISYMATRINKND